MFYPPTHFPSPPSLASCAITPHPPSPQPPFCPYSLFPSNALTSHGPGGATGVDTGGLTPAAASLFLLALPMFHAPVALFLPLTAARRRRPECQ